MALIANQNGASRTERLVHQRGQPLPIYVRRNGRRLPWRWTVLIVATLSTLLWIGIMFAMIALLS